MRGARAGAKRARRTTASATDDRSDLDADEDRVGDDECADGRLEGARLDDGADALARAEQRRPRALLPRRRAIAKPAADLEAVHSLALVKPADEPKPGEALQL